MRSRYAVAREVSNDHLVRVRDRSRRRELLQILCAVAPLGLGLMGYVWTHAAVLDQGYSIDDLEKRVRVLTQKERQLELAIAAASAPSSVEARARESLAMSPPTPDQVIFLDSETLAQRWPVGSTVAARPMLQGRHPSALPASEVPP